MLSEGVVGEDSVEVSPDDVVEAGPFGFLIVSDMSEG